MTSTPPDVALSGRYSVTQAAKALGVEYHSIYRFLEDGRLKLSGIAANGRKYFSGEAIIKCWKANF